MGENFAAGLAKEFTTQLFLVPIQRLPMATCKECGKLLPMDYFLIGICQQCVDNPTEVEYDSGDINLYSFLENFEEK